MIAFDLQPTLVGPRIVVRPLKADDWNDMFRAAQDPEIWALHPASDRYQEPVFREFFDGALASGSAFAFVDSANNAIVGSSRYHGYNPVASEVEIGWTFLERAYWGGSYNLEIKQLMLTHAFTAVDTVVFWIGEENLRSRQAILKIGAVLRDWEQPRSPGGDLGMHMAYEICKAHFYRDNKQ